MGRESCLFLSNEKSELCKWPFGACIIRCGVLAGIGEPGCAPRGWLIPLSWRRCEGCRRPRALWVQEAEGAARGSTRASGISPLSLLLPGALQSCPIHIGSHLPRAALEYLKYGWSKLTILKLSLKHTVNFKELVYKKEYKISQQLV